MRRALLVALGALAAGFSVSGAGQNRAVVELKSSAGKVQVDAEYWFPERRGDATIDHRIALWRAFEAADVEVTAGGAIVPFELSFGDGVGRLRLALPVDVASYRVSYPVRQSPGGGPVPLFVPLLALETVTVRLQTEAHLCIVFPRIFPGEESLSDLPAYIRLASCDRADTVATLSDAGLLLLVLVSSWFWWKKRQRLRRDDGRLR